MNVLTSVISALLAFAITAVLGFIAIPFLHKLKFGQTIRDEGPAWHKNKNGTPTMGGIMIAIGAIFSTIISLTISAFSEGSTVFDKPQELAFLISGIALAVGMGLIGFIDDYIKVVKKRNLGLTAKQKTILQFLVSCGYLASLYLCGMETTWVPFLGWLPITEGIGLIFWPIAVLFVYGFTNAVNLTDGLDGLASTVTMIVCCVFMLISAYWSYFSTNVFALASAGACLGFLVWNAHPAKVFMGDTGSMFLGGIVVALSFSIGRPILLIFAGIPYIIEAFSVMLQVAYYKKTKKRLFKMAPIHHHFEMKGYSEEKVVFLFSIITALGSFAAMLLAIFG